MSVYKNQHIKYRPDIDGLRALAVLLVVFYHVGFDTISGGFIGVDIFFVISGYLITKIIVQDLDKQKFSIISFYERRIRRILPALYLIITVCIIFTSLLFLPNEFDEFGQSIIAASLFVSNMLFWHETGYFNSAAELKPLLHTWSLAVEEQFYIFFPLLLIFIHKFFRRFKTIIIFCCALISLALSIWATTNAITANFYFAPTRAWELLIGSLLAVTALPQISRQWLLEALGALGLTLIVYTGLTYSYATAFPGLNALAPCAGAGLIIYSGQLHQTFISRALSLKPMVLIGLCSYSLYLWHWPVIVFIKYISASTPNTVIMMSAICLSFLLSYLSWRFIETPFRKKTIVKTRKNIFSLAIAYSLILLSIGTIIILNSGVPQRFKNIEELEILKQKHFDKKCIDIPAAEFNQKKCHFGKLTNIQYNYVIWGDSHARAMTPAIVNSAKRNGQFSGFLSSNSGCLPLIGVQLIHPKDNEICTKINETVLANIHPGMTVFLVARWTYYTNRSSITKEGPVWIKDSLSFERSENENHKVLQRGLIRTVQYLQDRGTSVVLVNTVPEFPKNVPDTYWRFDKNVSVTRKKYDQRVKKITPIMQNIEEKFNIIYIEPSDIFCDKISCEAIEGNKVLFRDNDHISLAGAEKISPLFDPVFKKF